MTFRKHQAETLFLAERIFNGERFKSIFMSITPGGGKSALPGILASALIPNVADNILWVVPRNSLRSQGEADFPEWSRYRVRAASNESDPCRGTQGYVTTYQAIVANPERHLQTLSHGRWIVFFDEPHHIADGGEWHRSLEPLVNLAKLIVYASGTFARGDGQRIAGIKYDHAGKPVFENSRNTAFVSYTRSDALKEGAIVPVHFSYLDGRAEWEEDGEKLSTETLAGDYAPQALFTALRTEYAYELLDECVASWRKHRAEVYAAAKLLVVAPNIALAEQYQAHLHRRKIDALIATSDDSAAAIRAIEQFKGNANPTADVLVSVGMAYEGLSVPKITHIACLTHIRSIPWLEQCFARANRTAPGKVAGFVYGPNDKRFREAIESIEREQIAALQERGQDGPGNALAEGEEEESSGSPRQWIIPIGSKAHLEDHAAFPELAARQDGGLTPREAERTLRTQIARHIEIFLEGQRSGSKQSYSRIIYRALKDAAGGKAREDCSVDELTAQWMVLKERWPV